MTTLTFRDGVMILQLIFYTPALGLSIWLTVRHGIWHRTGFIYLVLLALVRLNGACMMLATLLHPYSIVLYTGAGILNSIALSPLFLSAVGLLCRVNESINRSTKGPFPPRTWRILSIVILIALSLSVVGGTLTGISGDPGNIHITTRIGVVIFLISFICIAYITARTSGNLKHAERDETRLGIAVAVAIPFLLVRTVYSVLCAFSSNPDFNVLVGSVAINLCMAVIEEFIVVALFLAVGFTVRVLPKKNAVDTGAEASLLSQYERLNGNGDMSTA